jgi:hypothetical protein
VKGKRPQRPELILEKIMIFNFHFALLFPIYSKAEITQAVFSKTQQKSIFWQHFSICFDQGTGNNEQGKVRKKE